MTVNIYTLTSPIHNKVETEKATAEWIGSIEQATGKDVLRLRGEDFSEYGNGDLELLYVRTGGTEGLFKALYENEPRLREGRLLLLTSGKSNSLAASMEILSWLRAQGREGEILHGDAKYVAQRIILLGKVSIAKKSLKGKKIGVIGEPSDWLIASSFDTEAIQRKIGVEVEKISMEELLKEIRKRDYPIAARKRIETCPSDYFIGALEIYGALKRIVEKHGISALTLRCFDLLSTVKNTGCLALALLNEEGIPSSCEGDVPALLTMMISYELTGETGFQANPSRINPETDEMVLAHCTIPLNMITHYEYDTHYESGIGVAIRGKMQTGLVTLCKLNGDLSRHYAAEGILQENLTEQNLCRTQVKVSIPGAAKYLLNNPIGNHHIILRGQQKALIDTFMNSL